MLSGTRIRRGLLGIDLQSFQASHDRNEFCQTLASHSLLTQPGQASAMHRTRAAASVGSCCPRSEQTANGSALRPLDPASASGLGLLAGRVPSGQQNCASGYCSYFLSIVVCAGILIALSG